ncbi:MAG: DEAD/DEAH box helicase [Thermofilaceae archaeon]
MDLGKAFRILLKQGISPEELVETLLNLLQAIDPAITDEQVEAVKRASALLVSPTDCVTIREIGVDGAIVLLPHSLSREDEVFLESKAMIEYYKPRILEGKVELSQSKLNVIRKLNDKVLQIPYFAVPTLKELLESIGLKVLDEVNWCTKNIEVLGNPPSLYKFQEEALNAWLKAGMRGTIVMPTGAGKTYVAIAAISILRVPTLICVTTVELARQWSKRIRECLNVKTGFLTGGDKRILDITVATYHSAAKNIYEIFDKFCFIIYDEGHHLPAETFKEIAFKLKAKCSMVLSATPNRADKNEVLIYRAAGEPVYKTSYYQLVLKGVLAPFQVEKIYVKLGHDEAKEYMQLAEKLSPQDLRKASELIKIASKAKAKLEVLKKIIESEGGKTIVFCQYLDQAQVAFETVKSVEPRCVLITGSTQKGERLKAFEAFRKGIARVIVTTTVLDEGIDVPDADVAVVLSGSGQTRQMVQRLGRVLRWTPGKIAKVYEVIAENTIEEALSRSRSVFKLFDVREVKAALEIASTVYEKMCNIIENYKSGSYESREEFLEKARAEYVKLSVETARTYGLQFSKP